MDRQSHNEDKIKDIIKQVSEEKDDVSDDLLYNIYRLEEALAPMERREGITRNLRHLLESEVKKNDT